MRKTETRKMCCECFEGACLLSCLRLIHQGAVFSTGPAILTTSSPLEEELSSSCLYLSHSTQKLTRVYASKVPMDIMFTRSISSRNIASVAVRRFERAMETTDEGDGSVKIQGIIFQGEVASVTNFSFVSPHRHSCVFHTASNLKST